MTKGRVGIQISSEHAGPEANNKHTHLQPYHLFADLDNDQIRRPSDTAL